jgi:hypothetical protein
MRVFQNFCKLTFPCHPEAEGQRISSFDFLIKKKNIRFFTGCRMTIWIFETASVLNFMLFSHYDKEFISGFILQPAKDLSLFVILQLAKNLFIHFSKQEIFRLCSFRTTDKIIICYSKRRISYFLEFFESLITIDLVSEEFLWKSLCIIT